MIELSIVIPSLGRKEELYNTISDLSKQSLSKYRWEVIVVIQNEPDIADFIQRCQKWDINLRLYYSSAPNASLARNIGLLESQGDIVLFLDDDLVIENPHYLEAHLNSYKDTTISGVYGQVLDPDVPERNTRHKWSQKKHIGWMFFPANYNQRCRVENGTSSNLSVLKNAAIDVGGMDICYEKGAHREESDFCLRLTRKHGLLLFEPLASVIHLGAAKGGCRQWGKNEGLHPMHHIFGEWYFILKGIKIGTVKWYQLHYHLGVLILRQIWNLPNRSNKKVIPRAFWNSLKGFFKAFYYALLKKSPQMLPKGYTYKQILAYEF